MANFKDTPETISNNEPQRCVPRMPESGQIKNTTFKYDNPILNERKKTHGSYLDTACLFERFMRVINDYTNDTNKKLSPVQYLSLVNIAQKEARILSGNPNEKDHWRDIAGYAELVVKDLEF